MAGVYFLFFGKINENVVPFPGELLTFITPLCSFTIQSAMDKPSIFIIINLGLVFIISIVSGLFLKGGTLSPGDLFQVALAYSTTVIPMLFLTITAVFLAQFFKNSGTALAASFLVYLAGKAVPFVSSTLEPFFVYGLVYHVGWKCGQRRQAF